MMKRSLRIGCIALCAVLATGCGNQDGNTRNDAGTETTPTAEATPTKEATPTAEATPTNEATPAAEVAPENEAQPTAGAASEPTAEEVPKAKTGNSGSEKDVGLEKAKSIALSDAGLKEKNVRFKKEKREWDDGRMVYEIEFYSGNKEYDYEIEASTGKVISRDYETEKHELESDHSKGTTITLKKAKQIALKKAGLAEKDGIWKKEKTDQEDGRMVYELKFISKKMEYEFEIDAESGKILEFEKESVYA